MPSVLDAGNRDLYRSISDSKGLGKYLSFLPP